MWRDKYAMTWLIFFFQVAWYGVIKMVGNIYVSEWVMCGRAMNIGDMIKHDWSLTILSDFILVHWNI